MDSLGIRRKWGWKIFLMLLPWCFFLTGCGEDSTGSKEDLPAYSGNAYVEINDNIPYFSDNEMTTVSFETYSELDALGRCGPAYACIGTDTMPVEERGQIGAIKPSGWQLVKYNGIVEGNYLYNRCHLIAYQLAGENANTKNLITGTRYLNVEGMLPFEDKVADHVKETGGHVLYRVTPIFEEDNLVASGVLMEAKSVEDEGKGILFNVYCYNVQPGVSIDYADGSSWLDGTVATQASPDAMLSPKATLQPEGTDPQPEGAALQPEAGAPQATAGADGSASGGSGRYAVNGRSGKIHINGACPATGTGDNAMKRPVYFDTYEEAEAGSIAINPQLEKRRCGNCW